MLMRWTVQGGALLVILIAALTHCGDSHERLEHIEQRTPDPTPELAAAAGGNGGEAGALVVPEPIDEPFVDPYPRTYADGALTKRMVEGELELVGSGLSSCTNQLPAPGDRWCAFSRANDDGATELWVVNVSQARVNAP